MSNDTPAAIVIVVLGALAYAVVWVSHRESGAKQAAEDAVLLQRYQACEVRERSTGTEPAFVRLACPDGVTETVALDIYQRVTGAH